MGVEMLRYAQHDRVPLSPRSLRSGQALSRSEGSVCMGVEMLRYAQHDRVPLALTPDGHPSHSSPPSHPQHLMSFFLG